MKRLIGVGVGPGDPELVTVKAVRAVRESDAVLVPVLETGGQQELPGRAEATVRHYTTPERVRRVPFALDERGGETQRRTAAWERAAAAVGAEFDGGAETVAFATIGDPNVYSTFTYLARAVRDLVPELRVDTCPGIIAMQDLAARSGTVLVEGTETLTLVPLTDGIDRFREALESGDTVVAYKCGARMPEIVAGLAAAGRLDDAAYGAMLGLDGEDVRPARELGAGESTAYLSTVVAPPTRNGPGGKLR